MYQYYGTAKSNFEEYLKNDVVNYKKYFYTIRPLLSCIWIDRYQTAPPVLFEALKEHLLDQELRQEIDKLQKQKMEMNEYEKGPKIEKIHDYIKLELDKYSNVIHGISEEKKQNWDNLNRTFLKIVYDK